MINILAIAEESILNWVRLTAGLEGKGLPDDFSKIIIEVYY
jgi:hypothetical protein